MTVIGQIERHTHQDEEFAPALGIERRDDKFGSLPRFGRVGDEAAGQFPPLLLGRDVSHRELTVEKRQRCRLRFDDRRAHASRRGRMRKPVKPGPPVSTNQFRIVSPGATGHAAGKRR